jgi:hypothetical protein
MRVSSLRVFRLEPHAGGTRFTYEHTGFTGIGGFLLAKLVLGPVRKKMLSVGLPAVLNDLDDATLRPPAPSSRNPPGDRISGIGLLTCGDFEDLCLWCPDECGGIVAGGPDVCLQEAEEAFCLAGGVEVEVDDHIVGVADRPLDALWLADEIIEPAIAEVQRR